MVERQVLLDICSPLCIYRLLAIMLNAVVKEGLTAGSLGTLGNLKGHPGVDVVVQNVEGWWHSLRCDLLNTNSPRCMACD
jgi:hypothetical protein